MPKPNLDTVIELMKQGNYKKAGSAAKAIHGAPTLDTVIDIMRNGDYDLAQEAANRLAPTPLHDAISNGNLDQLVQLMQEGADPFVENEFGQTPLQYAMSLSNDGEMNKQTLGSVAMILSGAPDMVVEPEDDADMSIELPVLSSDEDILHTESDSSVGNMSSDEENKHDNVLSPLPTYSIFAQKPAVSSVVEFVDNISSSADSLYQKHFGDNKSGVSKQFVTDLKAAQPNKDDQIRVLKEIEGKLKTNEGDAYRPRKRAMFGVKTLQSKDIAAVGDMQQHIARSMLQSPGNTGR